MDLITNPTPKQEFLLDSKRTSAHRGTFSTPAAQDSLRVALAQYQRTLSDMYVGNTLDHAAMLHLKVKGAHEFLDTLLNLAEAPKKAAQTPHLGNLKQAV